MNILALTDEQLIRLFTLNKVTSEIKQLYISRVKRTIKSLNHSNIDSTLNSPLFNLPFQYNHLLDDYLNNKFLGNSEIFIHDFNSDIIKMERGNNLLAVATKDLLLIIDNFTGNQVHSFNLADSEKFTFGFDNSGKQLMLIKKDNNISSVWIFDTKTFEGIRESRQINICPDQIFWIADNVVQFHTEKLFGTIIIEYEFYHVYFNPAIITVEKPELTLDFDDISYEVLDKKLLVATVYDLNYSLINLAARNCNNDLNKMEMIKKSDLFERLTPMLKSDFSKNMFDIGCQIIDNDRLI